MSEDAKMKSPRRFRGKIEDLGPYGKTIIALGILAMLRDIASPGWLIAIFLVLSAVVILEAVFARENESASLTQKGTQ